MRRSLARFRSMLGRLMRERRGNVAMMFGLTALPLCLCVGAAVDYTRASDLRTLYAAAADAAALATVAPSALSLPAARARRIGEDVFDSRVAQSGVQAQLAQRVVSVTDKTGVGRTTTVTFSGGSPSTLMQIAGLKEIAVTGDASAFSAPPVYMDFYMLLDNTPSMGVAATTGDISKMETATQYSSDGKCAFACHIAGSATDNYAIARKNGVTMRIDVVRQATQQLMDTARATTSPAAPNQFRAAVYTFGSSCGPNPKPQMVSALSPDLMGVKTSAGSIDLMATPSQNYFNDQCTDYDATLAEMNKVIPSPGDGWSSASAQKVLFFVSDGVADAFYPSTCTQPNNPSGQAGRCQEPITVAGCKALRDRGIKIAALYTTYLPLPQNNWYKTNIAPFSNQIGTNMKACASDGYYFEVGPNQGISEAMTALFNKVVTVARLSD